MENPVALGIDIGGTKINAACVSNGKILSELIYIPTPKNPDKIVFEVLNLVSTLSSKFNIKSVGIATAGVVDINTGEVLSATKNLADGYKGINYKQLIESKFGFLTIVDNDANAAAYGEHKFGAAKGYKDAIVITLGTGIGSGIIINNNLHRGKGFAAGECGHIPVELNSSRNCTCGKNGCWETFASGTGMVKTAINLLRESGVHNADIEKVTTYNIIQGVKNQDSLYLKVYKKWHEHIAVGLIALTNILAPECLVLGGSMSEFIDFEELSLLLKNKSPATTEVKQSLLGNAAGIIGAASMAETFYLA